MFTSSPRFATLAQQVARMLEEDIRRGVWRETLPGERQLAATLQVSRRTIRAATVILSEKKLIHTVHGAETRVLKPQSGRSDRGAMRAVGLLLPDQLEHLQPFATVFVDSLRMHFYNNEFRLDTHVGHRYFSGRPAAALTRLVTRSPCDGWILAFSNRASQVWFHAQGIPTIVIGTAHDGIALPFVDIDMLATSRHAAGVLLRKGHRHIALIIEESERPGDAKTQQGFFEGLRDFGEASAIGHVFRHGGNVVRLQRLVERILQMPDRPTALFIANPYHYLAVAGILAEKGLRVPRDISLLCRDDDYCLRFLPTAPSRYVYSATMRAKEIFSTLMWATQHQARPAEEVKRVLILPEYFEGGSIAALDRK